MAVQLYEILNFVRSWSEDDAYNRFGLLSGREWLISELRDNQKRRAIVATAGKRIVGLLDHIECEGAVHIGVFVDSKFRRLHVATGLVCELLRAKKPERPVTAECRRSNAAAIGLLFGCGFEPVTVHSDEVVWHHQ